MFVISVGALVRGLSSQHSDFGFEIPLDLIQEFDPEPLAFLFVIQRCIIQFTFGKFMKPVSFTQSGACAPKHAFG